MGKGALAPTGNVLKCVCALQNAQYTNIFKTCRQLLGASPQTHWEFHPWTAQRDFPFFVSEPNLPALEKNPADAHVSERTYFVSTGT